MHFLSCDFVFTFPSNLQALFCFVCILDLVFSLWLETTASTGSSCSKATFVINFYCSRGAGKVSQYIDDDDDDDNNNNNN